MFEDRTVRMDSPTLPVALEAIMQELRLMREENAELRKASAERNEELRRSIAEKDEEIRLKIQAVAAAVQGDGTPLTPSGLSTPIPKISTPEPEIKHETKPEPEPKPAHRPRPRLPDPAFYEGNKTIWPGWKLEMENKLREDADALGNPRLQFTYVYSRLAGKAKQNVTTYVRNETRQTDTEPDPAVLLTRLELLYGDHDLERKAIQALHSLKQGENESFNSFYPRFEKEISNANAESWPDNSKISYLVNALNDKLKMALVPVNQEELVTYVQLATRCQKLSNAMELLGQWKKSGSKGQPSPPPPTPQTAKREDMMEWEPTPTSATQVNTLKPRRNNSNLNGYPSKRPQDRTLLGKRAKWVSQEEIDARRLEHRCLRCGRDDCRILTCPLAAPIRPGSQPRIKISSARPQVTEAAVEEEESSQEEGEDEQ